jgi:hypothetical protein
MATQTDLDRLQIAWRRLQDSVNNRVPFAADRIWRVQVDLSPPGKKPGPSRS